MPYAYVEPEIFLTWDGVNIWHVYHDGTDEPWQYWFTTDKETADESHGHGRGGHFDARRLTARWPDSPNVAQWDEFWKPRFRSEDEAITALIMTAIEEDRLPK